MDVTPYLEPRIAPRAVFDSLPERRSRTRFMLPTDGGDFTAVTWGAFADQIRRIALFVASEMETGERAAIFAPNRVEWMSAALGIQAAGGVMVPIYRIDTSEQAAYVIGHSDAKVLFVDEAPLLERVLTAWSAMGQVKRIVLLDDGLDAAAVVAGMAERGLAAPPVAEVERRVISWSRALSIGAARDRGRPARLRRAPWTRSSLDQPALMLYTSGTSRQPEGRPAHAPQRGGQRRRLAAQQRAAPRGGRRRPVVAADEPHLRLRRGVPRQHPRLHHVPERPGPRGRPPARTWGRACS